MSKRPQIALALCAALTAPVAQAESALDEALRDFERQTEEFLKEDLLGPDARAAVERLLPMIESLMERLPIVIDNLPEYELPEILPNGDIIIRRKRKLPKINPDAPPLPQDGIKT